MKNKKLLLEIDDILDHISNAIDAQRSTFFLIDRESSMLESIIAQGLKNITLTVPIGKGIAGRVAREGSAFLENDVQNCPIFDRSYDNLLNFVTVSTICVPVTDGRGKTIGVLQSLNKRKGRFTKKDVLILSSFATTVALVVKNARLYRASEHIKGNFSTLLEVFAAVSSELHLDNLIELIMIKAAQITGSDRSSLFFIDREKNELWTKYAKGLETKTVRTKKGIVGLVAKTKKPLIVNDPYNHPSFDSSVDFETGYKTRSIVCVPLFNSRNDILGVLQVINKIEGGFETNDLAILEGFATQIRIALENARLFDQINSMKNYLSMLVENLDNGIVTIDDTQKIQTINNTFYRIFDLGKDLNLTNKRLDDLGPKLIALLKHGRKTMETGKKHYKYGLEHQTEKGKKVTTNLSVLPMHNPNGKIIGAVNVFQDITREKRIRSNLSRYIPQHLVNEVINKDDLSILRSKNRKCSILFSDVRNFTKLTEELGATQIVELLNKYFNSMVGSIHQHNGILDKFIGDAVMGVFGLPYTNTRDSINAVKCALDMFKELDDLNKNENLGVSLDIGIGISTGEVVSGNIGSDKRFEYTVIGDPVNLAARLEDETKNYDSKILICEHTFHEVSHYFNCKKMGIVPIKGKQNPVKIYGVLSS